MIDNLKATQAQIAVQKGDSLSTKESPNQLSTKNNNKHCKKTAEHQSTLNELNKRFSPRSR